MLLELETRRAPTAADFIRNLVCGYPSPIRLKRLMAMLQGYADDSGSDGVNPPYILAGFVLEAEKWALFADDWQIQLDRSPAIKYCKMAEAYARKGEFLLMQPEIRDRKVRDLLEVIEKHKPAGIYSAVDWREFRAIYKPVVEGPAKDPYHCLVPWLFDAAAAYQKDLGIFPEAMDFDFDEQGKAGWIVHQAFPCAKQNIPEPLRIMLGRIPIFLDDKKFPALQAADMWAWSLRRHFDPVPTSPNEWEWLYERLNKLCFGGVLNGPESHEGMLLFNAWRGCLENI